MQFVNMLFSRPSKKHIGKESREKDSRRTRNGKQSKDKEKRKGKDKEGKAKERKRKVDMEGKVCIL